MPLSRRSFLGGLIAAPAVIRSPRLLMPVRPPVLDLHWVAGPRSPYPYLDGIGIIGDVCFGQAWVASGYFDSPPLEKLLTRAQGR